MLLRLIPGRTLFVSAGTVPTELTLERGEQENNTWVTGRLASAERRVLGCNKDCCRKLLSPL